MQGLSHLPGWGEKNFQVLGKAFETIKQLSQAEFGLGKKDAFVAITGLVAKLSDVKLKGPACEALSALGEAVGAAVCLCSGPQAGVLSEEPKGQAFRAFIR